MKTKQEPAFCLMDSQVERVNIEKKKKKKHVKGEDVY